MANDVAITPVAHAFIRYDVIGKGAKVNAKLAGLRTLTEKAKLQRTFYNIGAGINAAYGAGLRNFCRCKLCREICRSSRYIKS